MNNLDIIITHANKNGKIVSINDVPNGINCNCTCTKCGEPLVAKNNGKVYRHFFAHLVDSDCNGESEYHTEAKDQIYKDKFIWIPNPKITSIRYDGWERYAWKYELQKFEFQTVEKEKLIGDSKFRADLLCTHANGKQLVVEIAYTHFIEPSKAQYLIDNKIPSVEINLRYDKASGIYWDMLTEPLSDYMRHDQFTNITRWVYTVKNEQKLPDDKKIAVSFDRPKADLLRDDEPRPKKLSYNEQNNIKVEHSERQFYFSWDMFHKRNLARAKARKKRELN